MQQPQASEYARVLDTGISEKRMFDIAFASSVGSVVLVGGGITALAIAAANGVRPVFRQKREGLGGNPFSVIKLRTMRPDGDMLRLGLKVRDAGLDETPQFINVLLGDMSVAGYRPLLTEDVNHASQRLRAHFSPGSPYHPDRWLSLREQCRPGVTGPAQTMPLRPDAGSVNHLADVVAAECTYMENATMITDLQIILKTPNALRQGHNPTVLRAA